MSLCLYHLCYLQLNSLNIPMFQHKSKFILHRQSHRYMLQDAVERLTVNYLHTRHCGKKTLRRRHTRWWESTGELWRVNEGHAERRPTSWLWLISVTEQLYGNTDISSCAELLYSATTHQTRISPGQSYIYEKCTTQWRANIFLHLFLNFDTL